MPKFLIVRLIDSGCLFVNHAWASSEHKTFGAQSSFDQFYFGKDIAADAMLAGTAVDLPEYYGNRHFASRYPGSPDRIPIEDFEYGLTERIAFFAVCLPTENSRQGRILMWNDLSEALQCYNPRGYELTTKPNVAEPWLSETDIAPILERAGPRERQCLESAFRYLQGDHTLHASLILNRKFYEGEHRRLAGPRPGALALV